MLFEFIAQSPAIAIVSHSIPDLDTLSSAASLKLLCSSQEVHLVCADKLIKRHQSLFPDLTWQTQIPKHITDLIVLDCSNWERTRLKKLETYRILNLDHHKTNDNFGDFNYVIKSASSTCEMLSEIFRIYQVPISKEIAQHLLNGIYDDTKSLQTPSTSSQTLKTCSYLMKNGANSQLAYSNTQSKLSSHKLKAIGKTLMKTYINQHGIAISKQKGDHKRDHLDLIIDLTDQIPNKNFSALLTRNHKGLIRGSLRNNRNEQDMTLIANHFGGGGHKRAAGFTTNKEILESVKIFN